MTSFGCDTLGGLCRSLVRVVVVEACGTGASGIELWALFPNRVARISGMVNFGEIFELLLSTEAFHVGGRSFDRVVSDFAGGTAAPDAAL